MQAAWTREEVYRILLPILVRVTNRTAMSKFHISLPKPDIPAQVSPLTQIRCYLVITHNLSRANTQPRRRLYDASSFW